MTVSPSPSPKGVTVSDINRLCAIFLNNPEKTYVPKDFKQKESWNYSSVKKQLRRLLDYGIIRQLPNKKYILDNREEGMAFLEQNGDTLRYPSMLPPHRIRTKAHNMKIGIIDMSGEPLDWMLKLNMLTKPSPNDPAQNVGLRKEQAKKFNMRISLKTGRAVIFPKAKGWESELHNLFSWCDGFIRRFDNISENMEIAINFEDLQRIRPDLADIPFEEIQGIELNHNGMHIQLCRSQFKEGEVCIRSDSIEETMSLADKITYGGRSLAQAMKETAFEKDIYGDLQGIKLLLKDLPFSLATLISGAVKEGVKEGIKEGFNEIAPIKKDEKFDVA